MKDWLVKVRHGRGGESILASYDRKGEADSVAAGLNHRYQTDNHYVERFDPHKLTTWIPTKELTDEEIHPKW